MYALPEPNLIAARWLVEELAASGLCEAVVCPGSRSTPMVLALADSEALRTWVVNDERSAAFFALGMARESDRPVLLLCTSGTAAANFLPAVVEASGSGVALVVVTADRPPELRDCGAPQTIDQVGLFGSHVRWACDLPAPGAGLDLEGFYRAVACRAAATAGSSPRGPVHLNLPAREPLVVVGEEGESRDADTLGTQAGKPHVLIREGLRRLSRVELEDIADLLSGFRRGLIVCGPGSGDAGAAPAIAGLAASLDWPILACPLSGLRHGDHDRERVVDCYDVLLRDEDFRRRCRPDAVVRFGRLPASKPLQEFLAATGEAPHFRVAEAGWPDPLHARGEMLRAEPAALCRDLAELLTPSLECRGWTAQWAAAGGAVRRCLDGLLDGDERLFAGRVFRELHALLPDGAALHVGNSMPVRDVDTFLGNSGRQLEISCNRGANGIDGVLSTAFGAAAVREAPTVLVLGDLSFLHDLGALQIAARYPIHALVTVINDDGGGIFSFLPQAGLGEKYQAYFSTPHGLTLETVASLCDANYTKVSSWSSFSTAALAALEGGGLHIAEIAGERAANRETHAGLIEAALAGLSSIGGPGE